MSMRQPHLASRLQGLGTTIFSEMTALAIRTGAINLGQGFPDEEGPPAVVDAAVRALQEGHNQYAPGPGIPSLRTAVANHQRRFHGLAYDPDHEVTITFGATEAMTATILALCEVGDEIVVFDPTYDAYLAAAAMAGAGVRRVALRTPDLAFDPADLDAAITPRTRLLVLNSPHNPTGKVFSREELEQVAQRCRDHDLVAVTDEVYEHLVFDDVAHVPLATLPGMRERTVTISSAAKTFSFTGWKVGWACGPADLTACVRTTKQFLSFAGGTPLQHAVAAALDDAEPHVADLAKTYARKRDRLCDGLADAGLTVARPAGTYFTLVDVRPFGLATGEDFCRWAPQAIGVAAVPLRALSEQPAAAPLVRLAFCKRDDVLDEAVARIHAHLS